MKLFVSALEPSSNIHLKFLLDELKKQQNIELFGVFSKDISNETPLYIPENFSVMGFVDVIKNIRFFLKASNEMCKLALKCDKILLMDSSSFHIPLAKKIKKTNPNKEIIYYILPQIWAWKPWRAKIIEKYFDKLVAIFPFELQFYKEKARFMGHPLLDEITNFKDIKDFKNNSNLLTFMPGSRIGEISRIFPIFIELKNILKNQNNNLQFNLVVPKHFKNANLNEIYKDLDDFNIVFNASKSLYESDFAFICSGTATLECALIGTPFILVYKAKKIDAFIVKKFLNIKYVGLANILYSKIKHNEFLHDEFLQDNLNVENLLNAYNSQKDSSFVNQFIAKSVEIRKYLNYGSAKNVSNWIIS